MLSARMAGDLEAMPMLQESVTSQGCGFERLDVAAFEQLTGLMRAKNGPGYFARGWKYNL